MLARAIRVALVATFTLGVAFGAVALGHGTRHRHHFARKSDHTRGASQRANSEHIGGQCERYGRYSPWDEEWTKMSIEGDRFEIRGGEIAQQRTSTVVIHELGERLISDHSKSLMDTASEARELGIEVPGQPSPSQQWELQVVSSFSGHQFDVWYAELEVKDHMQDIEETKSEIEKGCNPDLKKLAQEDLPVLEEHLHLSEQALAAVQSSRH